MQDRLTATLADRYRIERELGVGGMATVFLAQDVRHDRYVAIKVLKPELAAVLGADRFVVEIKTTAALQHPHILPLFDSGTADGLPFYVMPYIQGETIRDRLNRETQFGVDEAVRIAREVADALDYAHRHGVIHRDIKPENILLHDGRALVMDFGIALAVSAAAGGRMTETGLSLGTPHYMSPEQATAEKDITARSDVYSLASVLYEMLAGEPPHTAGSAQAVIMKIIADSARPVRELRKQVPANVDAALAMALEKLPADRFESARAFSDALANPGFGATDATSAQSAHAAVRARRREVAAWTMAVGLGLLASWAFLRPRSVAPPGIPMRLELVLSASMPLQRVLSLSRSILISADGSTLVYTTPGPGAVQIAKRRLDETTPTVIPGTEGATHLGLSPDGKWVAFFVDNVLKKVPLAGGPPTTVAAADPSAFSWGRNDTIVIGPPRGAAGGLSRVAAAGGVVRAFSMPDTAKGEMSRLAPRIVDDAGVVLFASAMNSGGPRRIGIASLKTGQSTLLDLEGDVPLGVIDGHLVFSREDGAIAAAPIDIEHRRVTGEPIVLVDNAAPRRASLSDNGTLVYETGSGNLSLALVDEHGAPQPLITTPGSYANPRFSPDGKRIAVAIGDPQSGSTDVWVFNVGVAGAPATAIRLAPEKGVNHLKPEWSPDGKRIFFAATRFAAGDTNSIWSQPADGSAPPELVVRAAKMSVPEVVISRDNGTLVLRTGSGTTGANMDIWYRELGPDTTLKPLLTSPAYNELQPALSPDGKWLAYVSNESGRNEVYVRAFPGPASKWPVSANGGTEPMWARDGRHLYYRGRGKMMAAAVTASGGTFSVTATEALFDDPFARNGVHANYDVAPNGKGFLMVQRADSVSAQMIVVNLGAELRKRQR